MNKVLNAFLLWQVSEFLVSGRASIVTDYIRFRWVSGAVDGRATVRCLSCHGRATWIARA